ncbi:hypothetical protein E1B28_013072 [Marasmius oreades]|uniref:Uncharacterized protein n=1 Tax=Marasmius oreades TaxID=181124 RepID=A0A9P7RP58_9AGAR|nr:uncharacterized protein E1B28_013072 [Marasmius oreades]KAG7087090.1 hypothetical protein E1B28_013072 [Marasmius oreades]
MVSSRIWLIVGLAAATVLVLVVLVSVATHLVLLARRRKLRKGKASPRGFGSDGLVGRDLERGGLVDSDSTIETLPASYSIVPRSHDSQLTAYNEADISLAKYEDDTRLESTVHSTPFKFSYQFDDASEEVSLLLLNPHSPDGHPSEEPEYPLSSQRRIPQDLPSLAIPSPKSKQITVVSPVPSSTPSSPPSAYSQTSATTQLQRTLTGLGGRMSPPPVPPLPLLPASPTLPSPLSLHLSPLPERGAEIEPESDLHRVPTAVISHLLKSRGANLLRIPTFGLDAEGAEHIERSGSIISYHHSGITQKRIFGKRKWEGLQSLREQVGTGDEEENEEETEEVINEDGRTDQRIPSLSHHEAESGQVECVNATVRPLKILKLQR